MTTKPLVRVNIKLRRYGTDNETDDVASVEIPALGTVELTLDRDAMGRVFVAEHAVIPDEDFTVYMEQLKAAVNVLQHDLVRGDIASRRVHDQLFELEKYLAPSNPKA